MSQWQQKVDHKYKHQMTELNKIYCLNVDLLPLLLSEVVSAGGSTSIQDLSSEFTW